ncbi:MAG: HDOD domain-containing protein [Deltaproteobacteria bacterium]|nr:HDOD domain-containing protein [Deltaproteobacteria bacterium]
MVIQNLNRKDEVLDKIRRSSDLPGLAETIGFFNALKEIENRNVTEIANAILKDYGLTTKLLKVVNSVHYLQVGEVTTISRAIFLLGIEYIKNIALALKIFDHFQKNSSNREILNTISQAFCGGIFAQKIIHDLNFVEEEEAFICSLLHPLGKILVAFSLPEKIAEVRRLSAGEDMTEDIAASQILGISYEELGMTIAREWNFPKKIVRSMRNISRSELVPDPQETEKLSMVATLSTEISNTLGMDLQKDEKTDKIGKLIEGYKNHITVKEGKLDSLIAATSQDLNQLAEDLNLDLREIPFNKQLEDWAGQEGPTTSDAEILEFKTEALKPVDAFFKKEDREDSVSIFSKGIQEINTSMLRPFVLNDIITIALETIHRGMKKIKIERTLFFVKDTVEPIMKIRFGFGDKIETVKKWFIIELERSSDIFNLSVSRNDDLIIQDIYSKQIKKFVPDWYRKNVRSSFYMILLPISIKNKNIGLISLEGFQDGLQEMSQEYLNYMKILRDQIVLAIKQLASEK